MKKREHPKVKADYSHHMELYHPPLLPMPDIPVCLHYGAFLTKRQWDVHTGIDLYSPVGSKVYAIESGEVVAIRPFTGKHAGCEHWNETWDVCIEGYSGTFDYGEIKPIEGLKVGDFVNSGDVIGHVLQVLKKDKGKAMSMLHFSIHSRAFGMMMKYNENENNEPMYDMQIDPTLLLLQLKNKSDIMMLEDRLYKLEPDKNW